MCDTLIAMQNVTADGSIIFGKNSDRDANEPQYMMWQPRMAHDLDKNPTIKATYIEIPQVKETYATVLSRPSWMWGAEMGLNEHGLVIGNEGVFTRVPHGPPALTGMDMIRLALERTKTADEALDCITELLALYGQGGNGSFEGNLTYHNSFIIADRAKAYILETAGKYWAASEVKDVGVISNGLSIGTELTKSHHETLSYALKKGWVKSQEPFSFTKAYEDKKYALFTKFKQRRCLALDHLKKHEGHVDMFTVREILRMHEEKQEGKEFCSGSMGSICMHSGGLISSQSTASIIVRLSKDSMDCLYTASSIPCISLFKPYWFGAEEVFYTAKEHEEGIAHWMKRETIHRAVLAGRIDVADLRMKLNRLEEEVDKLFIDAMDQDEVTKHEAAIKCAALDEQFADELIAGMGPDKGKHTVCGGLYFKSFWKKTNARLGRTSK